MRIVKIINEIKEKFLKKALATSMYLNISQAEILKHFCWKMKIYSPCGTLCSTNIFRNFSVMWNFLNVYTCTYIFDKWIFGDFLCIIWCVVLLNLHFCYISRSLMLGFQMWFVSIQKISKIFFSLYNFFILRSDIVFFSLLLKIMYKMTCMQACFNWWVMHAKPWRRNNCVTSS